MEKKESKMKECTASFPEERWKVIEGFSKYMVSTEGRVRNSVSNHLMVGSTAGRKYRAVLLRPDSGGKAMTRYVHRLVAEAFIPNPDGLAEVDHVNADRFDNRACNLQWMTRQENIEKHMRDHGYWYNPDAWHRGKPPKRYACPSDTAGERWLEIDGHPGYYISDQGRVWSVYVGLMNTKKRSSVSILRDGVRINKSIRTLVASAFLRPREEGERVGFSNKDHTDCRASNLYWYRPYKPMSHKRGPRGSRKKGAV